MTQTLRIAQSELGNAASMTLLVMLELAEGDLCIATHKQIAAARGVTRNALRLPMQELQDCGVVTMASRGVYRINIEHLPGEASTPSANPTPEDNEATCPSHKGRDVSTNGRSLTTNGRHVSTNDAEDNTKGRSLTTNGKYVSTAQPQKDPFPLPPFLPPSSPCIPNNPPIIPPCSLPQKACSAWKIVFGVAYGFPKCDLPSDHPAVSERHLRYHMAADWSIKLMEKAEEAIESYRIPSAVRRKLDRDRSEVLKDYANTYRLLEERDGYEWEEVRFGIHWLFTESDWLRDGYIASVNALRRKTRSGDRSKFDVILTQAKADNDYEGPNSKAEVGSKTDRKQRGKRDDESLEERYQRNYEAALRAVSA